MAVNTTSSYQVLDLKGPTLEEYLKTPMNYIKDFDVKEALNEETRNSIAGLMSMIDPEDPKSLESLKILQGIKDNVDKAAENMSHFGLDNYTRQYINDARVNANQHLPRITKAISDLNDMNKLLFNYKLEHPGIEVNVTGSDMIMPDGSIYNKVGLDDILYQRRPSVWRVDTNNLNEKGYKFGLNISTRLIESGWKDLSKLFSGLQGIYENFQQNGFRLKNAKETLMSLFNEYPVLMNFSGDLLSMTDFMHMTDEQQEMIAQSAMNGIYSGLVAKYGSQLVRGNETGFASSVLDDYGYDFVGITYKNADEYNKLNEQETELKNKIRNHLNKTNQYLSELRDKKINLEGVSLTDDYFDIVAKVLKGEITDEQCFKNAETIAKYNLRFPVDIPVANFNLMRIFKKDSGYKKELMEQLFKDKDFDAEKYYGTAKDMSNAMRSMLEDMGNRFTLGMEFTEALPVNESQNVIQSALNALKNKHVNDGLLYNYIYTTQDPNGNFDEKFTKATMEDLSSDATLSITTRVLDDFFEKGKIRLSTKSKSGKTGKYLFIDIDDMAAAVDATRFGEEMKTWYALALQDYEKWKNMSEAEKEANKDFEHQMVTKARNVMRVLFGNGINYGKIPTYTSAKSLGQETTMPPFKVTNLDE